MAYASGVTMGPSCRPEIAGHDPASDLVVLRVGNLDTPPLPHASAAAHAGELVLVTGRAWNGRAQARLVALTGVAGPLQSAHGPRLDRVFTLPLSPYAGFSGSALTGPDGALLGVATAGLVRGRGLALPVDLVQPIVEAIEKHGGIPRGYLGVVTQPVRLPPRRRGNLPTSEGFSCSMYHQTARPTQGACSSGTSSSELALVRSRRRRTCSRCSVRNALASRSLSMCCEAQRGKPSPSSSGNASPAGNGDPGLHPGALGGGAGAAARARRLGRHCGSRGGNFGSMQ